ncbi:RES family NAD+ phosphorylase [Jatrophihabitans sp.]|uniref:RES family NAD+ phosphorylase n=1 Tax=Jatrophihabitans sp. TaxID=1932789 RepID=UPI002CA0A4F8|nr:RES family NAD+ phosphorylase [Jatrophihabitans sp.]
MQACAACFKAKTWLTSAFQGDLSIGTCDFGHGYAEETWPTTAWDDSLTRLLALYEIDNTGAGLPIEEQIQRDWQIFSLDLSQIRTLLQNSGVASHELLGDGVTVRLWGTRTSRVDPITSWTQFSQEIRTQNRYFPTTVPDLTVLEAVIRESRKSISEGTKLLRARVSPSAKAIPAQSMGAPPPHLATAGRANPVGIAYLYLAFELDTCVYESRVPAHEFLSVATFRLSRKVGVLNLAEVSPPDLFSAPDLDAVEDLVRSVSYYRYLSALGRELSKPVRSSDGPTDYIPTQYLCELAKSMGFDGVQYASSVYPKGHNVVLFDTGIAMCENVTLYQITSMRATWEEVAPASR